MLTGIEAEALAQASIRAGSDILAPACGLGTRIPLKNVQALMRACQEMPCPG